MFAATMMAAMTFLVQVVACDSGRDPEYVVGLCADGESENPECGTGFAVDDRTIVTARHVVQNVDGSWKTGLFVKATQYYGEDLEGEVMYVSETYDIALVRVEKHLDDVIPMCDSNLVEVGDEVETHGFFGRASIETSKGVVSRFYGDIISSTAKSRDGFSGGPLVWVDQEGGEDCAVGVVYAHVNPTGNALASPLGPAFMSLDKK